MPRTIYRSSSLMKRRKFSVKPVSQVRTLKASRTSRPNKSYGSRSSVLLAVTPSGWAYDLRCTRLMEYLKSHYIMTKQSVSFSARHAHEYDLVYAPGFESIKILKRRTTNLCTTIGGLVVKSMKDAVEYIQRTTAVSIVNLGWYKEFESHNTGVKAFYIPNGVQTERFKPVEYRTKRHNDFVVGWVGNDSIRRLEVKRIHILRETCKKLGIKLVEKNWKHNYVTHDSMPDFYKRIDLYVNCSTTEGSNNPILEASSAAVPILATPVGNVPELISSGVIPLRTDLGDLADKIMYFKEMSPEERRRIGDGLRTTMVNEFDWRIQAEKYRAMFEYSLQILGKRPLDNSKYIIGE